MAQISIIKKSELEGASRIDAEYYQPKYLKLEKIINALPYKTLTELAESVISFGAYSLTNYIEWKDNGVPFIVAENIKKGFIDYSGARFIDDTTDELLSKSRVKESQVLLSMSGSVGNAAVANRIPKKLNSNQDVVKITVKKDFSPYALAAFLNSDYGRNQILRVPVGSVQQHIFLWQIKGLKIPTIPFEKQKEIEEIYIHGLNSLRESQALYYNAEQLLLEELKINKLDFTNDVPYCTVSASKAKAENRLDAEYYQPKYFKLIEHLRNNFETKYFGELMTAEKGIEPGSALYQIDGRPFYRVSNLSKYGITDNNLQYLDENYYQTIKNNFQPNPGEILLSKDATPGIAYVLKEPIEGIISSGILRIKLTADVEAEYLSLLINSIIGKMQIERDSGGSIINHWRPDQIKALVIPILSKSTQKQIADLGQKAYQARKEAKSLLAQAIRTVEQLIEYGDSST